MSLKKVISLLLVSALALTTITACQGTKYNAIELVPDEANLIANIQISRIINDQDIRDAYDETEKPPDQPQTFEAALDEMVEEIGIDLNDFSQAVVFVNTDAMEQDGYIGIIIEGTFEAEQFRMLRSNLLFPLEGKPPRRILVTSAIPGEGKSFVAANLAVTFALDIQLYVLLIDCDIRKPNIHKRFGYRQVTGLSEYLRGDMEISSILLNTNVPKLKILPGGRPPKNPSELLSSKRMSQLLREVKEKYPDRYIILDSPPPKLTAETNVLSRQADGILLVAKYGRTRREDLTEVIDKFGRNKIIGVVINWFNLRASRYYGYGKYGGYKYYYGKPDE